MNILNPFDKNTVVKIDNLGDEDIAFEGIILNAPDYEEIIELQHDYWRENYPRVVHNLNVEYNARKYAIIEKQRKRRDQVRLQVGQACKQLFTEKPN